MCKISIDTKSAYPSRPDEIMTEEVLCAVTTGCLETHRQLGDLGRFVEVFKVVQVMVYDHVKTGAHFTVHFRDPLGQVNTHSAGYEYGKLPITKEGVVELLMQHLPRMISEHLERSRGKIEAAREELEGVKTA